MNRNRFILAQLGCLTLFVVGAILGVFILYTDLFLSKDRELNHSIPDEVNVSSLQEVAQYADHFAQRWQNSLFLTRYAATYQLIGDEHIQERILRGEIVFRYAGRRSDLLQDVAERFNVAHLLASVAVDVDQGKVVRFHHSQGSPFGYDAPLNLNEWPIGEDELFEICDAHGGKDFRLSHNVTLGHVGASAPKPGREWRLVYNASPQSFKCIVNIDTGQISVRDSANEWREVGTWMEITDE